MSVKLSGSPSQSRGAAVVTGVVSTGRVSVGVGSTVGVTGEGVSVRGGGVVAVGAGVSTVRGVGETVSGGVGDGLGVSPPVQPDRASRQAAHRVMSFFKGKALPSIFIHVRTSFIRRLYPLLDKKTTTKL